MQQQQQQMSFQKVATNTERRYWWHVERMQGEYDGRDPIEFIRVEIDRCRRARMMLMDPTQRRLPKLPAVYFEKAFEAFLAKLMQHLQRSRS